MEQSEEHPDAAVCYRGRIFGEDRLYNQSAVISDELRLVDFITSVKGAIYRRSFFSDSIFTEWREWFMNDDIVVSAHLRRRGVPMLVVPVPKDCRIVTLDTAHIDPLYVSNVKRKMNDMGLKKVFWK